MPSRFSRNVWAAVLLTALLALSVTPVAQEAPRLQVRSVDSVGMTVHDMDRALVFYTGVLPFRKEFDIELSSRAFEQTGTSSTRQRSDSRAACSSAIWMATPSEWSMQARRPDTTSPPRHPSSERRHVAARSHDEPNRRDTS